MAAHPLSALIQSFLPGPTFPISSLPLLLNWNSLPSSFSPVWPSSEREPQLLSLKGSQAQTGSAPSGLATAVLLSPLEGTAAFVCCCCSQWAHPVLCVSVSALSLHRPAGLLCHLPCRCQYHAGLIAAGSLTPYAHCQLILS